VFEICELIDNSSKNNQTAYRSEFGSHFYKNTVKQKRKGKEDDASKEIPRDTTPL